MSWSIRELRRALRRARQRRDACVREALARAVRLARRKKER